MYTYSVAYPFPFLPQHPPARSGQRCSRGSTRASADSRPGRLAARFKINGCLTGETELIDVDIDVNTDVTYRCYV